MIKVRKGQAPPPHSRAEFGKRFRSAYFDPAFRAEQAALDRVEAIAWDGYHEDRKAPVTNDWMAEIYERWTAAHGVLIVTPVHWYQVPSVLKLMIDRLVCADGGNPDVTSTAGKNVDKAKALEMAGWPYPKHLAGRAYGLVVHGDVAGIEGVRRALSDWLDWMGLIDAGGKARLDRFVGYYEPYATSHEALDRDVAVQDEVRNVAQALVAAVGELRAGRLSAPGANLAAPRPK